MTTRKLETKVAIGESAAWFEESVRRKPHPSADDQQLIVHTREGFARLIEQADQLSDADNRTFIDRGRELARLRAYILPKEELVIEGRAALSDMATWSVPGAVIDKLTLEIMPLITAPSVPEARGALRSLLEVYDYWESYVQLHARTMRTAAALMLLVMVAAVTTGVFMFHFQHIYSGVFCAGTAGALLSILSKLPPVMSSGETNAYILRILSRLGIGIASSLIGMGLLSADLITIKTTQGTIAQILDQSPPTTTPADHKAAHPAPIATNPLDAASADPAAAGDASTPPIDAGAPAVPGDATPCNPCATPNAAPTTGANAPADPPRKPHMPQRDVLLLMAIAMLFGFSERALSSFEDVVIPPRVVTAAPANPQAPPPPAAVTPPVQPAEPQVPQGGAPAAGAPPNAPLPPVAPPTPPPNAPLPPVAPPATPNPAAATNA